MFIHYTLFLLMISVALAPFVICVDFGCSLRVLFSCSVPFVGLFFYEFRLALLSSRWERGGFLCYTLVCACVCVLSVMVCLLFLLVSLVSYILGFVALPGHLLYYFDQK